jgi:predicted ATPase
VRSLNRSNLPAPANPIVGRRAETERVLEMLRRTEVRLVTMLGPGGAGKTRLALEIGAEASTRYRDGVWLVGLGAIADPALVVPEIVRVLQIEAPPGQPLERALAERLRERELLLLFDNFEHVIAATADVGDLLAVAPDVDVLVTSREALRIVGEHRFEVPPLPLDDARELFRQRASAVAPDLRLVNIDGIAVSEICSRLDGLPLAVELAAARVAVLPPKALATRLAQGLDLPAGARDLPERQRTLRATIEWSYRLLEPAERRQFQTLAPFIGGARIESAEAVSVSSPVDALEASASLRDKSLLRMREDPDGEPRFLMLETIRAFAIECAGTEGTLAAALHRHAEYFLQLVVEAAEGIRRRGARRWLERRDAEYPNVRAALDHLAEHAPEIAAGDECLSTLAAVRQGLRRPEETLDAGHREAIALARELG